MTITSRLIRAVAAITAVNAVVPAALAQGLLAEQRLSSTLAHEAVGEAVAACAKNNYAVSAIVVDLDGVRQAMLRGNGAPVHTLDSAYAKAYTAASLAPVRGETSTRQIFERIAKQPGLTTTSLAGLPNVTFTPGGVTIVANDKPIGGIGVGGAPGGNFDDDCARAALDKIKDRMR
jgi:uncharacterized protein GlcG (DUF336 family)